jgi:hypothetical protein
VGSLTAHPAATQSDHSATAATTDLDNLGESMGRSDIRIARDRESPERAFDRLLD